MFSWKDCDDFGESKIFYTCVLTRDVRDFEKGYSFDYISYNTNDHSLRFYEDGALVMIEYASPQYNEFF